MKRNLIYLLVIALGILVLQIFLPVGRGDAVNLFRHYFSQSLSLLSGLTHVVIAVYILQSLGGSYGRALRPLAVGFIFLGIAQVASVVFSVFNLWNIGLVRNIGHTYPAILASVLLFIGIVVFARHANQKVKLYASALIGLAVVGSVFVYMLTAQGKNLLDDVWDAFIDVLEPISFVAAFLVARQLKRFFGDSELGNIFGIFAVGFAIGIIAAIDVLMIQLTSTAEARIGRHPYILWGGASALSLLAALPYLVAALKLKLLKSPTHEQTSQ